MENGDSKPGPSGVNKGSIEQIYQKKTQLEHILLRPDTYIGCVAPVKEKMWIFDKEAQAMVLKDITYVPGLYKIFDEILVNAADNKIRDPSMDRIDITIDPDSNVISIWNNGKGIPVVKHKVENMYVPTLIFGHLLTSSNYNDEEMKVTGGRNGFGAKLCNIFSTRFTIETACKEYKTKLLQTWSNNMSKVTAPVLKSSNEDFTMITFSPDLGKFGMEKLDDDIVALMSRRAYDIAASARGVKVYLNKERLPVKSFKDYVDLYVKSAYNDDTNDEQPKIIYENVNHYWEVAVTASPHSFGFTQVSFVNSIATTKGGRHVDYVTDMMIKHILEILKKKHKGGAKINSNQVKQYMWVFINCLIVNPTFDSQTKENMTLQVKNFGSKCTLSDKFFGSLPKAGIVERVLLWVRIKEDALLSKQSGKKQNKLRGIPKLEDANDAGSAKSLDCTLILTEGDSAKTLAVSGLGVVGRDKYGVFPLRGKLLNVREASHKQITENAEISSLVKILGLQYHKKYETIDDLKSLRYGRLMIMTDQDQDGSHIKGLIINFIHHNWASLLKLPFLEEFITPIIKAKKANAELSFFSIPEFEEWKNETDNWHTYKIKYYKGLGTSTSKEAKEYFLNMARHRILFKHRSHVDDEHIMMAFSKKKVDERKHWLTTWMGDQKRRQEQGLGEDYLYAKDTRTVTYEDFINKELVLFSNMDNERSIPSLMDGLKPGSRKVLFTCLKRNLNREIKVAQLAGSVAEHSAYHHGEQSLMSTIINLCQNYVGSNNINLLQPIGQFGTRLQGGKDAASPRYIFTMLSPLTRLIFHPSDDPLLKYLRDDNLKIEPSWYMPIIPMILINGADGIGTGWMTKIPNHSAYEVVSNIRRMIRGEEPRPMKPAYKNFKGEIEKLGDSRYVTIGEVSTLGNDKIEITELPIGVWTQVYKEQVLEVMLHGSGEKVKPSISDYKEYNTDTTVKFIITMTRDQFARHESDGFHKAFKLQTSISISSMCAFDKDSVLQRFDHTSEMLKNFFGVRLEYYGKRKDYLEGMLQAETLKLSNQARFILEKCDGDLRIENKKKKDMIDELIRRGYDTDPVRQWKIKQDKESVLEEEKEEDTEADDSQTKSSAGDTDMDYEYLLGMKLWALTLEKKNELLKKKDEKFQEYEVLKKKSPSDLWNEDLDAFVAKLEEVEAKEREEEQTMSKKTSKDMKKKDKTVKLTSKKKLEMARDSLPSPSAVRVAPKIDEELMKRVERAQALKESKEKKSKIKTEEDGEDATTSPEGGADATKPKKVTKPRGPKKEKAVKAEKPEKAKKGEKTTKAKKGAKNKLALDSDDSEASSDIFKMDTKSVDDEVTPVRTTTRRAATSNKRYIVDDESSSAEEEEFYDNVMEDDIQQELIDDPQGQDEVNGDLNVFDKSDDDDSDKEAKSSKPATAPKAKPANGDVGTSAKTKAKPSTSQQKGAKTKKNPVSNDSEDSSSPNKAFSFSSDSDDDKPITARGKNDGGKKKNFRMDIYSSSGSDFEDKPPVKKQQQQKKQTNVKPRVATKKSAGDAQNKASTHRSSDDLFDTLLESKSTKRDAPSRSVRQFAKKTYADTDSDDDDEDDDNDDDDDINSDDYVPEPKKSKSAAATTPPKAKSILKKPKRIISDSDSD